MINTFHYTLLQLVFLSSFFSFVFPPPLPPLPPHSLLSSSKIIYNLEEKAKEIERGGVSGKGEFHSTEDSLGRGWDALALGEKA